MLSIIDLLEAGTVDYEAASLLVFLMSKNPSFLSCAGPGGAGKTTLMGALLAHLPENVGIVPYHDISPGLRNACVMAHEINRAPYRGYIFGADARKFFSVPSGRGNVSACATVHADTAGELTDYLRAEHGVPAEKVWGLDFAVFINFTPSGRRIMSLEQGTARGFMPVFRYDSGLDRMEMTGEFDGGRLGFSKRELDTGVKRTEEALRKASESGINEISSLRGSG